MAGDAPPPEPGAPIPKDAVDPELLQLPLPRPRRHPLVAGGGLVLGALLLWRLYPDMAYSLQPQAPQELGPVRQLGIDRADLRGGRHVALSGMPDVRNALAFDAKGERRRSYLLRLLAPAVQVFVVTRNPAEWEQFQDRFAGRLRRFDDLPYAGAVRDYYQKKVQVMRALDLGRLRQLPAIAAPVAVPDRAGEPITIQPDRELVIDVLFPDDLRVLLLKSKFPSEPDARHEVERVGLPLGPGVETADGYGYVLRLPPPGNDPARQQAIAKADSLGLLLWHRLESYRVRAAELRVDAAGIHLPGPEALPQPTRYRPEAADPKRLVPEGGETLLGWERVQAVQAPEPLLIGGGAFVLLDGEVPAADRWTLAVALLLVLFMGFNLYYLWSSFREGTG